jgi:hypothetical protein
MSRVLSICVSFYLIGYVAVKVYLNDIDLMSITETQSEILWLLGLVRDLGFWSFSLFAVILSFFNYISKKDSNYKKYMALSICGNLAYILFTGYMFFQLSEIKPMTGQLLNSHPELISKYQEILSPDHENFDENIKVSKLMAAAFYEDSGTIVKIIDKEGVKVDFTPSEESIKRRNDMLHADALIQHQVKSMQYASITQAVILFIGILLGLISPRAMQIYRERKLEAAN